MIEKRFSAEAVARKMGQIYNRLASVQGLSCGSLTNGVQVLEKEQARE